MNLYSRQEIVHILQGLRMAIVETEKVRTWLVALPAGYGYSSLYYGRSGVYFSELPAYDRGLAND